MVKATLVSYTKDPIALMCWTRRAMHADVPDTIKELIINPKKYLEGMTLEEYYTNILLKDGMPTFYEYVNMTFKLEGVSRALTHQLVRHRIGFSFSQQSMRCIRSETFATDKKFELPDTVKDKETYTQQMLKIEQIYNEALKNGVTTQDARGLLPMNIHTTITFSCNLRSLIEMINKRLCYKTQGEFQKVAYLIIKEVETKMDQRLAKLFCKPCDKGYCIMKAECEQQLAQGKLKGEQNTSQVCPIYLEKFCKETKQ